MKHSINNLSSTLLNGMKKLFFCSQVIIISLAVPSLFYVGISYNNDIAVKKHLILTNKGKKFLASDNEERNERTIKYSAAFMQI